MAAEILPLSSCERVEGREYVLMMSDDSPIVCTWKQASYPAAPGQCGWWASSGGKSINFTTRAEDTYFDGWLDHERAQKLSPEHRTGVLVHKSGRVCIGRCYYSKAEGVFFYGILYGLDGMVHRVGHYADARVPCEEIIAVLDFDGEALPSTVATD